MACELFFWFLSRFVCRFVFAFQCNAIAIAIGVVVGGYYFVVGLHYQFIHFHLEAFAFVKVAESKV